MQHRTKPQTGTSSAEDRALELFGEMLIEKLQTIKNDWKKPWFVKGACTWSRNLNGRAYSGSNAFMLAMLCEFKGYQTPVFGTYEMYDALNKNMTDKDTARVHVNKGEKSFPVFLYVFKVVDKETGERIKYDEYINLSEKEKEGYVVYPQSRVYNVFNIDQTNMKEVRPELYDKYIISCGTAVDTEHFNNDSFHIDSVDAMVEQNQWLCPINFVYGDSACFSKSKDSITLPTREQFISGEAYYGTMFHEMTHSTGTENRLAREGVVNNVSFGDKEYGKEELIAEISAAITALFFGMESYIKSDSVPYISSWLSSIKQNVQFVKSVLKDAKRASDMIVNRVESFKLAQQPQVAV